MIHLKTFIELFEDINLPVNIGDTNPQCVFYDHLLNYSPKI